MKAGILDNSHVCVHYRLKRSCVGTDLIILLLGYIPLLHESGIAPDLFARVFKLGIIFCEVSFCLFQCGFIGAGINRKEQSAPVYILPFFEMDAGKYASDLRFDRYRRVGFNIPYGQNLHGNRLLFNYNGGYRNRRLLRWL